MAGRSAERCVRRCARRALADAHGVRCDSPNGMGRDDVVVMDNLAVHKVAGVRDLNIPEPNCDTCRSPDFNPIEKCWSKVKQLLRAAKARSLFSLERAVTETLAAVTPQNTQACFRHCGYGL